LAQTRVSSKHGRQRDSHLPAQEKLGPCANVTDAVSPHNPVLTLNSAADYPPPITMNGRSTGFANKRSVITTIWLESLARAGFRYSPQPNSLVPPIAQRICL